VIVSPRNPLQLVAGLIVWSVYFVTLYGGMSVACSLAPPDAALGPLTWINALLALLIASTTLLLASWSYRCWRATSALREDRQGHFIAAVASGLHLVAAVSVLAIGLPVLGLPPCV
jgi:hypothetical protein